MQKLKHQFFFVLLALFLTIDLVVAEKNDKEELKVEQAKPTKDKKAEKTVEKKENKKTEKSKEKKAKKVLLEEDFARNKKILDEIYVDISGFGILKPADENRVVNGGGAPTYGEITYEALQQLIKDLGINPNDVVYDLGSGVGKFVLQVYANSPAKKVVGIELSETRHQGAEKALERFKKKNMVEKGRKVAFVFGNILDENLKDATIIYTCSTCFSRELMEQIAAKLSKLKKGLRFLTLKKIPTPEKFGFVLTKEYNLPMSWAKEGNSVYLYELTKK